MKFFRTEIHGNLIEGRLTDLGAQTVLLNGRIVSKRGLLTFLWDRSHYFDITDEQGAERHVEVTWTDKSKLGLGMYRMIVRVDGTERARVAPMDNTKPPTVCHNCGYDLKQLPIRDGEVCCPECGRHISARIAGLDEEDGETPDADAS